MSFSQLGNSVEGKGLTNVKLYVEFFFQNVIFNYKVTKYQASEVQHV